MDIIERFKKYISVDTKSNEENATCPSTLGQLELGKILVEELKELGIKDAFQDKNGYVYGTLEKNIDKDVPTVGFIAHMDTAPDLDGKCINPQIFTYKGGDIKLNEEYTMKVSDFPILNDLIGMELITTDGTTLLGADDKAGVSEIMDAIQYLVNHPEIKHGDIKIGFTPDEEIGRGADLFDVKGFGADFAYTMDGGPIGELEYENFNAATAIVKIQGKNVHPGCSKNTMINSVKIGMEFESMLPVAQKPEYTENYEGFIHLVDFSGTVEFTEMVYIIRDHDMDKFTNKKEILKAAAQYLNTKYIDAIKLEITDSYFNMKEKIMPKMHIVELAKKSMEDIGIVPNIVPIRGGTDGAKLSFMGLPTPNIFAGGMNFHGRYEFIPIEWMRKASELIVKIAENNAK